MLAQLLGAYGQTFPDFTIAFHTTHSGRYESSDSGVDMTARSINVVINESVDTGIAPTRLRFAPRVTLAQEVRSDRYCDPKNANYDRRLHED